MTERFLIHDYETFSEVNLKLVGAYEYTKHPSTEMLCVAWKLGTLKEIKQGVKTRAYSRHVEHPEYSGSILEFLDALSDPGVTLVAHNALFERLVLENVLARRHPLHDLSGIPVERWLCTASLAAARSLPRNLEGAGRVLKTSHQKDMVGHRLMLKLAKPRKPTKNNPDTRHLDPEDLARLLEYCVDDIEAEADLLLRLPRLTPTERRVWCLDQTINMRGFYVDRKAVKRSLVLIEEETARLTRLTRELSGGVIKSTNQREKMLGWLQENGTMLPDLKAGTVSEALSSGLAQGPARRVLKIRQAISKTSTAKYKAFEQRSRSDSRLRDILLYHAAHPGRWGGMGVQPQNFPRGKIKDTESAIRIIKSGDLEMLRLCFGDPMSVFSSCLRGMIVAAPGKVLDVADYAAIEARVLFWLARHDTGIKAFLSGRDMYKELATRIFGINIDSVSPDQRFVGKTATLGCGYQMGWKKFMVSCAQLGQEVSPEVAQLAVETYRRVHAPVVKLWSNFQRAAHAAVKDPTKRFTINRVTWFMDGKFLAALLPSGRRLSYFEPSVSFEKPPWGGEDKIPVLNYWGNDSKTKQWGRQKTYGGKLTENICQAVARDLMAEAMLRIEASGPWEIVLTVHDELIAERDVFSESTNDEFCKLMAGLPNWAEGLPVAVAGFSGTRYRKG